MTKAKRQEIHKHGYNLCDWAIDVNMKGEQESNGSTEHLMEYQGKYYFVQVSWEGKIGRVAEINPNDLDKDDSIYLAIKTYEKFVG